MGHEASSCKESVKTLKLCGACELPGHSTKDCLNCKLSYQYLHKSSSFNSLICVSCLSFCGKIDCKLANISQLEVTDWDETSSDIQLDIDSDEELKVNPIKREVRCVNCGSSHHSAEHCPPD